MLWADVSFKERLRGIDSFLKLLTIPLLMIQFRRSDRAIWALGGVSSSGIITAFGVRAGSALPNRRWMGLGQRLRIAGQGLHRAKRGIHDLRFRFVLSRCRCIPVALEIVRRDLRCAWCFISCRSVLRCHKPHCASDFAISSFAARLPAIRLERHSCCFCLGRWLRRSWSGIARPYVRDRVGSLVVEIKTSDRRRSGRPQASGLISGSARLRRLPRRP